MIIWETGIFIFFYKTARALAREMMEVLSDRQLRKLSQHKYKRDGGYTLLEAWLQPFWNWTVEKCPMWWAPNAITFIGLLINVFTSLLVIIYNPDGQQSAPWWAYMSAAIGVFIYQTMDSIDGKQARRTGSSSPLGELFDHGCDAVSTVVLSLASLIHLRLKLELLMLLTCGGFFAFYLAHWVTYCTGALSFGKIDVVEIQFMMMFTFTVTALCGEDFWLITVPGVGMSLNTIVFYLIIFAGVLQALRSFHTIFIKGGIGRNGSTVADTSVIFPALPMLTVIILTVMIAKKSELSDSIYQLYPCLYLTTFGFVFAKVTCKLIVAHMCKSELEYWDSIYVGPALLFMNQYFDFAFPEHYVLWAAFVYNAINLMHYSHAVSSQICSHMGIYCFSLRKREAATNGVTTRQQVSRSKKAR